MEGLFNIQFIVDPNEDVYIIEVNPRSSRTVPFLSKATGIPLANIATKVALGHSLAEQGYKGGLQPSRPRWYVKVPVFSFSKLHGADIALSPEMKSTGEAIGSDNSLTVPSTRPCRPAVPVSPTTAPCSSPSPTRTRRTPCP